MVSLPVPSRCHPCASATGARVSPGVLRAPPSLAVQDAAPLTCSGCLRLPEPVWSIKPTTPLAQKLPSVCFTAAPIGIF